MGASDRFGVLSQEGVLSFFDTSTEPANLLWESTVLAGTDSAPQSDRAVIDVQWNDEFVVVANGSKLFVLAANPGQPDPDGKNIVLAEYEHEAYSSGQEAFSQILLSDNAVFVNQAIQYANAPVCSVVRKFDLGTVGPSTLAPAWEYFLDGVLSLQRMEINEDRLFFSNVHGALLSIDTNSPAASICSAPSESIPIEGCGGWRCFGSNL